MYLPDGLLDLMVGVGTNLRLLRGAGNGTFSVGATIPVGKPQALLVGDFNRDGQADVVVVSEPSPGLSLLLGDGRGGLQPVFSYPLAGSFLSATVSDFNRDG